MSKYPEINNAFSDGNIDDKDDKLITDNDGVLKRWVNYYGDCTNCRPHRTTSQPGNPWCVANFLGRCNV